MRQAQGPWAFGTITYDPEQGELLRDGSRVTLGVRGHALLKALLSAAGQPVSKAALMDAAWPGLAVEEVNLSVQIATLRKALGTTTDGQEWIVTVPRVGYRLPSAGPATAAASRPGPAAIAVLPFENLSGESEQDYFADGIVEDLITALSRFSSFAVVARNSSFLYKDRALDVREAARELGVRYVLQGSLRRAGNRVRVTAQLVEAQLGTHLWAEKFDGALDDIFDMQDHITDAVVGLVEPRIRSAEVERARSKRPGSLDAYDLYLRALPHFYGIAEDGWVAAIDLLERAVALAPDFAMALAYAAWAHEKRYTMGLPDHHHHGERAIELARAGLKVGGNHQQARTICAFVLMIVAGESRTAWSVVQGAYEANPNDVVVLCKYGEIANLVDDGDLDLSLRALHRALELSPGAPERYEAMTQIGEAHMLRGEYEEAVAWSRRSLATLIHWPPTYWVLAASYAWLGRLDEAAAVVRNLLAVAPTSSLGALRVITDRGGLTRYRAKTVDGLRLAGLPE